MKFEAAAPESFRAELKPQVDAYLLRQRNGRFATLSMRTKMILWALLTLASYAVALLHEPVGLVNVVATVLTGIGALMLVIHGGHDAAHDVYYQNRRLNRILNWVCFMAMGIDPTLWRMRHRNSHHAFPNVNGCDADIDNNPFLRLSPNHPRRGWMRLQHLYAPFIYLIVQLHSVLVQDFWYVRQRKLGMLENIQFPRSFWVSFIALKLCFFTLVIGLPLALVEAPLPHILGTLLLASCVLSCLFVHLFVGTHFNDRVEFPDADAATNRVEGNWVSHALRTSLDWSPTRRLTYWLTGGLNAHNAHHLFPNVSHGHYVPITRMIRAYCEKYRLPYYSVGFGEMIGSHYGFLRQMARG